MTLVQEFLIYLGIGLSCIVFVSYYLVIWKLNKLSLVQRTLLLIAFETLSVTVFGIFLSLAAGSLMLVPALLIITPPLLTLTSLVYWLSEFVALKRGIKFKQLAQEARLDGNADGAARYERQYRKSIFNIKLFGGAKELDKIESEYPSGALADDQTDAVLATLTSLFRREPK